MKQDEGNNKDDILQQVVAAMQEKKAKDIVHLDLTALPDAVTDYFVICHVSSKTQATAVYDYVLEQVWKNCKEHPYHREGYENAEWILIDYVNVVVHIFLEEKRKFYHLEGLWADAKITNHSEE
ncbi:ribosome silencing factor [Candidatus Sulfidibacterium hydrothermale]|uniref:ribosome silencing factor n=1 Tax=Candidatus Sulfidibacterium hydrothermale TaxID=2875962 RepID=UPI001F0B60FA|nr:ribosome silencing factor [Candidatus Sulfidibacterium hydrothermale]UBM61189.1 ribosome silencing factor [Candidatus Sulfidibacterium hydrothermale]